MKSLFPLFAALAALLFAASSALAQSSGTAAGEQYESPSDKVISGVVSEVRADGSSVVVSDGDSLYDMEITPDTQFVDGVVYTPEDAPPRGPTAEDLKPGLEVEVEHPGVLAQSYPAQGEATSITFLSPWYEGGEDTVQKTFRGYLTSVSEAGIRVQQNPDASIEDPNFCEETLDFTLTDDTEVSEALNVGERVEVAYTYDPDGAYTTQCPGKFPADAVVVLSDDSVETPENPGGVPEDGASGPSGGETSGEAAASDEYAVLPDTGGPSTIGVALTLATAGILITVYRLSTRQ